MSMSIAEYTRKRDFTKTKEPKGSSGRRALTDGAGGQYVIQKHAARRLHYDLRLEHEGALLSWAVPKGPSLDPGEKRLAVHVEDHPLDYATFEGEIPKGEYGAGSVMVWDTGTWSPQTDVAKGLKKGRLTFELHGEKLRGAWHLARMGSRGEGDKENWLLIKSKDEFARPSEGDALLEEQDASVLSGRRIDEISDADGQPRNIDADSLTGAKKAKALPKSLGPQLATLTDASPEGENWIHEIKYDGYRLLAFLQKGTVTLKTRNDKDWTDKFPKIAKALDGLGLEDCILDGELIAMDANGVSNFQRLQGAIKENKRQADLQFMVFDLPFALGHDLRASPLLERKRLLKALLAKRDANGPIRYSDHVAGVGDAVFENACQLGLEGIICKKADSGYVSKRSRNWLKVKCDKRQEFIVCGFTEPGGSRSGFGALHLAYYDAKKHLQYAGKVGTGFDEKTLKRLRKQFDSLAVKDCPLPKTPPDAKGTTWIKPEPVAEIKYTEQTDEGLLRHPVFLGLREDKPARAVGWESPEPAPQADPEPKRPAARKPAAKKAPAKKPEKNGVRLTNPDRVLYPSIGATKERIASYYESIAEHMLPYVKNRPLSLVRHPRGWTEKGFFQRHVDDSFPDAVRHLQIVEKGESETYGYVDSPDGLLGLLQMGTLEIHAWNSLKDDVDKPDQIVMDLDPDEKIDPANVVGAALLLRDLLQDQAGLQSFLKTTGGKGLHVVIPIRRGPSWDEVKAFSRAVANALKNRNPSAFTVVSTKAKRTGKIYIDYLRNGKGATAIVPFSTRAREGAPVSVPLSWDEASPSLKSSGYTINNALRRISQLKSDPWEGFLKARQGLTKSVLSAFGL